MPHSPAVGRAARFAGVAAAYFLASLVGVAFVVQPEQFADFDDGGQLARLAAVVKLSPEQFRARFGHVVG